MIEKKELKIRYKNFLDEYSSECHEGALGYIKENFWKCRKSYDIPDIMMQIYSELDVFDEKENIYMIHLNKIKNIFDINCNVLEVGGGMIPSFGNILAKEQLNIGSGTITVYDPILCTTKPKYGNLVLKKEAFTKETNINNYNLIVGIMPCDITEEIIRRASKERKNFYIQMCGCTHFTREQIYKLGLSVEIYQKYIIDLANKLVGEVSVDKTNNKFGIDYPVLYKKF